MRSRFPSRMPGLGRLAAAGRMAAALACATLLAGCSFITGIPNVTRVVVSVSPRVIYVNGTATAFGTAYDGNSPVYNSKRAVTFRSDDTSVATVNPNSGAILGIKPGVAHIFGSSGGQQGEDSIVVTLVPAKQVVIQTRNPVFRVGAVNGLTAAILDSTGKAITDRTVTWTSRAPSVVSINTSTGLVNPAAVGNAWIVASVDNGKTLDSVQAVVTVPPVSVTQITPNPGTTTPGQPVTFTATVVDSVSNQPVTGRVVRWSSDNPIVATIDSTGVATGGAVGATTIRAQVDRVPGRPTDGTSSAAASLTVAPPVAVTTTVNPTSLSLRTGASTIVTVTVRDASGVQIVGRAVRAAGFDPNVVQVSFSTDYSQATITARNPGSTTVVFQGRDASNQVDQGAAASLTVTVTP